MPVAVYRVFFSFGWAKIGIDHYGTWHTSVSCKPKTETILLQGFRNFFFTM